MITPKRQLGDLGEKIALEYLQKQGYKIIEKNYLRKWGEIDIIAKDQKGQIIFIEVKTGLQAEENITKQKRERILRTAEIYLLEKKYSSQANWQIDVILVELNYITRKANLRHLKNAVY